MAAVLLDLLMALVLQKEAVQKDIALTETARLPVVMQKVEQVVLLLKLTGHQQGPIPIPDLVTALLLIIIKVAAVQVAAEVKEAEAEINLIRTSI